jgi:hypothetical protein
VDEYGAIITASLLQNDGMPRILFSAYLFALYRRGESEYEDAEDPFLKGRIQPSCRASGRGRDAAFLFIHRRLSVLPPLSQAVHDLPQVRFRAVAVTNDDVRLVGAPDT